ncbi:MAG: hypothetical protein ACLT3D_01910 [Lawsonibacter sp.]
MLELINQMDTQESTVKVDLLHLNPTDPDGGCGLRESQWRTLLWAAQAQAGGTLSRSDQWKHP